MYEGETVVCVCATVVCEEVLKFLRMSVSKLCVRKLRVKELCMQELRVPQLCVRKPTSQATRWRAGRDVQQSHGPELTGQCFGVCPASP